MYGCNITKGIQNWTILQQSDGFASLELAGSCEMDACDDEMRVYARVVSEADGENVVPWKKCMVSGMKWKTVLTIPCGGLYRIETCIQNTEGFTPDFWSTRGDMIHHVGVGDVFVIAGQSNSVGYGKGEYTDEPELGVHVLKKNGKWDLATHPLGECTGADGIDIEIDPGSVGHSPWISFAKYLKKKLGYPIGLIQTALGGSSLAQWNPGEDGLLYRQMMKVIRNNNDCIKGVLWSQGCGDTGDDKTAETYCERFKNMVECMRSELGDDVYFVTLQINKQLDRKNNIYLYNTVQQQQRAAAKTVKNVCIAPTNDGDVSDCIHNSPKSNVEIGKRAAKAALKHIYNKNVECADAPDLSCAYTKDNKTVIAEFDNVYGNLFVHFSESERIAIELFDENGIAELESTKIIYPNIIEAVSSRKLGENAYITGGSDIVGNKEVPFDTQSRMPIIAFKEKIIKK